MECPTSHLNPALNHNRLIESASPLPAVSMKNHPSSAQGPQNEGMWDYDYEQDYEYEQERLVVAMLNSGKLVVYVGGEAPPPAAFVEKKDPVNAPGRRVIYVRRLTQQRFQAIL